MTRQALITGAASGLGWALTQNYLQAGWRVILVDQDADRLQDCEQTLQEAEQHRCVSIALDISDHHQLQQRVADVLPADGRLDLLINNAGITHRSQASLTDAAVFERVMAVNWSAAVRTAQLCLPGLEQAGGSIICISSMAACMPVPGRAAYGASKAAMQLHFEAWRPELLQRGISLLMVYPAFLSTEIEQNALGVDGQKTARPRTSIGSIQTPESMAQQIQAAHRRGKRRLYASQWSSRVGRWLWFHLPDWYQKMTWRRFAEELKPADAGP